MELCNTLSYSRFFFQQISPPVVKIQDLLFFNRWLRRYHHTSTNKVLLYYWKSIFYRLFILFINTLSFLLFLYTVSWRYKRDYIHASIDILFYIMFYTIKVACLVDMKLFFLWSDFVII